MATDHDLLMQVKDRQQEMQRQIAEIKELKAGIQQPTATNTGNSTINVNAGGVGLWVAVTCCVVMLASILPMSLGLYWVAMDSRDRGHQVNALYMSVPGLRDLVDRQMRQNQQTREKEESK